MESVVMNRTLGSKENDQMVKILKAARKQKGYTMRDLGEKFNVPHSFIGKVEKNNRRLDVFEFFKYCAALEISPIETIEKVLNKPHMDN